jgi:hypothetical protein
VVGGGMNGVGWGVSHLYNLSKKGLVFPTVCRGSLKAQRAQLLIRAATGESNKNINERVLQSSSLPACPLEPWHPVTWKVPQLC